MIGVSIDILKGKAPPQDSILSHIAILGVPDTLVLLHREYFLIADLHCQKHLLNRPWFQFFHIICFLFGERQGL